MRTPCIDATYPDFSFGNDGYPRMHSLLRGNTASAVTVLWESANGPIQGGYEPDHLCRNKLCINLEHVEIVTKEENNRRAHAKLTPENVLDIRSRLANGETKASVARRFGVAFMTITYIERRITWRNL